MKIIKQPFAQLLATFLVLSAVVSCGNNGPDKKPSPQPIAVETPIAPAPLANPFQLVLINAQTGTPLSGEVIVEVSGADAASVENPNALVSPNNPNRFVTNTGILTFNINAAPSPGTPVNIQLTTKTTGYFDSNITVSIDQPGFHLQAMKLNPSVFSALSNVSAPSSVVLIPVSPITGTIVDSDNVQVRTATNIDDEVLGESQFSLIILDGTAVTDVDANTVLTDSSAVATFYPIDANNVASMRSTPLSVVPNNDQILSLGLVYLNFTSGTGVQFASFDTDVAISFEVPLNVLNPITGLPITLNDTLKFFPMDATTSQWTDPLAPTAFDATVTALGATHATVDITVPANSNFETPLAYNLGWAKSQVTQCATNLQFDVVDNVGQPVEQSLLMKVVGGNGVFVELYDQLFKPWFGASTSQADLADIPDLPGELNVYSARGELLAEQITLADTSVISAVDGKLPLASLCDLNGATVQLNQANTDKTLVSSEISTVLLCDVALPVDVNGDPILPVATPAFVNVQLDGAVIFATYTDGATPAMADQLNSELFYQFGNIEFDVGTALSIFTTPETQISSPVPVVCPEL